MIVHWEVWWICVGVSIISLVVHLMAKEGGAVYRITQVLTWLALVIGFTYPLIAIANQ